MPKTWFYVLSALAVLALVQPAFASVVVNEIAWMGSVPKAGETANQAANNEWIELKNDGPAAINLSEWRLEWRGGQYGITIDDAKCANKEIAAGGYFLFERTDDTTVPSIAADCIYTGALSNSGELLVFKDSSGIEIGRADGSDSWKIDGSSETIGDNSTKETAQKTSSGWVTAPPTPRAANAPAGSESAPPDDSSQESTSEEAAVSSGVPITPSLTVYAGEDRIALQGALIELRGRADGINGEPLTSGRFSWNFGDGTTREGKIVSHTYYFPGNYTASLNVSSGEYTGADYVKINVVSPDIVLSEAKPGERGFIELYNITEYRLDLGGFLLKDGASTFAIERDTFISPKSALVFSNAVTGLLLTGRQLSFRDAHNFVIDEADFSQPLLIEESFERASVTGKEFIKTKSPNPGVYAPGQNAEPEGSNVVTEIKPSDSQPKDDGGVLTESQAGAVIEAPLSSEAADAEEIINSPAQKETAVSSAPAGASSFWFLAASITLGVLAAAGFLFLRLL